MKSLTKIFTFASSLWRYYIVIGLFVVLLSILQLAQPVLTGRLIDLLKVGSTSDLRPIVILVIVLFALDAGSGLLNNINGYLGDRMSAKLHKILAEKYFTHLISLPQSYYDQELSGKIIGRLNRGTQQISQFINMFANNFLQFVISTILALVLTARYSWLVALQLASLYPVFILMTVKTSKKWQKWQVERNRALDTALGRFAESITQIKVVKSYIQESRELRYFGKYMTRFVAKGKPQSKFWHKRDVERRIVLALIFLGVYMTIFVEAARGDISSGNAVTLMLLAFQIRIPIFSISFLVDNTQRAVADSKDYFAVMDTKPSIQDIEGAEQLHVSKGTIAFENVHFAYDNNEPVLKGVTFTIKYDSKVALVGESGEGKTTITSLLMRLYEPQSGTITIDGSDISKISQRSLREQIGVVFQDPSLFSGTIRENIAYASPKASQEEIENAARAANAHEFIEKFEKGYETQIGERGLKLSGGQKQRIAIARALLKNAPILVLDEATSSLDNKSEILVQEALERLMRGRTTIIIAHRLSTIQNVDTIITLKSGAIDEVGTPKELSKSGGIYSRLLSLSKHRSGEEVRKALQEFDLKA